MNAALLSNDASAPSSVSPGLPANQSILEAARWFESSLALLQWETVNYASKLIVPSPHIYFQPLEESPNILPKQRPAFRSLCENQMIRSSGQVQNFSFLGLMIVVCITILLVITAASLEWCVDRAHRKKGWLSSLHKATARQADHKLHLLRMALGDESRSGVSWVKGENGMPIIKGASRKFGRPSMVGTSGLAWYLDDGLGEKVTTADEESLLKGKDRSSEDLGSPGARVESSPEERADASTLWRLDSLRRRMTTYKYTSRPDEAIDVGDTLSTPATGSTL